MCVPVASREGVQLTKLVSAPTTRTLGTVFKMLVFNLIATGSPEGWTEVPHGNAG